MTNWRYMLSMGDLSAKEAAENISKDEEDFKCRFCVNAWSLSCYRGRLFGSDYCQPHIEAWLSGEHKETPQEAEE